MAESPVPGDRVVVVGVHQGAVDVENRGEGHRAGLPGGASQETARYCATGRRVVAERTQPRSRSPRPAPPVGPDPAPHDPDSPVDPSGLRRPGRTCPSPRRRSSPTWIPRWPRDRPEGTRNSATIASSTPSGRARPAHAARSTGASCRAAAPPRAATWSAATTSRTTPLASELRRPHPPHRLPRAAPRQGRRREPGLGLGRPASTPRPSTAPG